MVKYLYHGTQEDCLTGSAKHGLLPSKETEITNWPEMTYRRRDVVFLAETEESAGTWACGTRCEEDENQDCHPLVIRVRLDRLPKGCKIEPDIILAPLEPFHVKGSWIVRCRIPPEAIEVSSYDGWSPIQAPKAAQKALIQRRPSSVLVRRHARRRVG